MEQPRNANNSSVSTSGQEISPISVIPSEMLQNVFHLLPLTDLLKCREVSRKWKSAATPPTRKKCKLIPFSKDISMDQRITALKDFNTCTGVADGEFPVSKFHFTLNSNDRSIDLINDNDATTFPTFFELVSPFITELSIDFQLRVMCLSTDRLTFGNHDYQKLTCLNLEVTNDSMGGAKSSKNSIPLLPEDDNPIFSFLQRVIEKAPSMQNIFLITGKDIRERNTIPRCIRELGILNNLKLLTSLTINTPFERVDWESLISLKLKLKIFKVTLAGSSGDTNILKTFLETQEATLNNLIFHYNNGVVVPANYFARAEITVDLPCLPKLTKLQIREKLSRKVTSSSFRFPTLSYQTQLPALKELCLRQSVHQIEDFFSTNRVPLDSLEQINLPTVFVHDNAGIPLLQAVRIFPNIKKLQLNHVDEVTTNRRDHMRVIFENMTELEELCIPVTMDGYDSVITGLRYDKCSQIKEPPSESFNRAITFLDLPTTKTMACLQNLKVLRILRLDESRERDVEIHEISGHILKKMKSLKCLDFGVRKFPPIISIALKEDLEKHGIRFIIRRPPHRRSKLGLTPLLEGETEFEFDDRFEPEDEDEDEEFGSNSDAEDDDHDDLFNA